MHRGYSNLKMTKKMDIKLEIHGKPISSMTSYEGFYQHKNQNWFGNPSSIREMMCQIYQQHDKNIIVIWFYFTNNHTKHKDNKFIKIVC
jgi:hypothetical protein